MTVKKKGLGRGLEALLGSNNTTNDGGGDRVTRLSLSQLQPGKYQPRTIMDEDGLEELAASIRAQGVIQPVLVRAIADDRFEIIAGERRVRAAHRAGLSEVPVVIREVEDQAALAMALIENLQRRDLSPLEEARGISRLIDEFGLTHEQAAEAVGRSRSATTNLLRLLSLPEAIQEHIMAGRLEAGHARAMLSLSAAHQRAIAEATVAQQLSVREVEERVRDILASVSEDDDETPGTRSGKAKGRNPAADAAADWKRMEALLADELGMMVTMQPKGKGGRLVVQFNSPDELDGLLARLLSSEARSHL